MRTKVKLKGGISLIVLVITIIVMIILAAAIILSLSNSGIIGKANKAKTDTDISNAKDLVAMAHADWMLDEAKIKENDNTITSFSNYAEKKLQEAGYKVGAGEGAYTVTEDGEVYTGLTETARFVMVTGIKMGDIIKGYTVTSATYSGVTNNTNIMWKYLGINETGEIEIIASYGEGEIADSTKVTLSEKEGYLNGPTILNTVCQKIYSVEGIGISRSMDIEDVTRLLEHNEEGKALIYQSSPYWLASAIVDNYAGDDMPSYYDGYVQCVELTEVGAKHLWDNGGSVGESFTLAIRPIVKLDPSVRLSKDETSKNTWNISK